ncbi:MAG TPA: ATP-binding protein [Acidobacteriaceae bacterium]|nr:ATP-binding protein [Acidobacteriaceae bacterium]
MEPKEYTRLLIQMLLLPLLALSILAAGLAYSLQRVQKSAAWVDHSDQVIAHANRLLGLIVDEETGVRGTMPSGGVIRLVIRQVTDLQDETKAGIRITVADNGNGIPQHVQEHVFEPFFTTKQDTGTGLGLWVSKELIEKQGGRLRVHSSISGTSTGTVFSIYLPSNLSEEMRTGK